MSRPVVGVLALQGGVAEHLAALERCGARALPVRRVEELDAVDGIVLPGGESTTMAKLARTFELLDPLRERIADGMPAFGTCAGMILLADRIEGGVEGQETIGGLDVTVRRNAFGRQVDSFESDLEMKGLDAPVHAVFIRAPWVERVGPGVEVLAALGHGRSYGAHSRFVFRTLPGILESGLWQELESRPQLPTRGLVTDIGNDIFYGFSPEQTLGWIESYFGSIAVPERTGDMVIWDNLCTMHRGGDFDYARYKRDMRRAQHDKVNPPSQVACSNCGEVTLPHRACAACGFYKGRRVVAKKGG